VREIHKCFSSRAARGQEKKSLRDVFVKAGANASK